MLKQLTISNYAIIDELQLNFSNGLNIITGETGAGKSILLGALSLVLGQRADTSILFDNSRKCIVEATFDISGYNLESFFDSHDLDYDPTTILRREIATTGKSRAFINDTPVNLNMLRQLAARLVNTHSQHETLTVINRDFQRDVLDLLAGNREKLTQYQSLYEEYVSTRKALSELESQIARANAERDYLGFLLEEFERINLIPGEDETIQAEVQMLSHAREIRDVLAGIAGGIQEEEPSVNSMLNRLAHMLETVKGYHPSIQSLYDRLDSVIIELDDIATEAQRIATNTEVDDHRLEELQQRLNEIYRLEKKHQVGTVDELLQVYDQLRQRLDSISNIESDHAELTRKLESLKTECLKRAKALHESRKNIIPGLESQVANGLKGLGMPRAQLKVNIRTKEGQEPGPDGIDIIEFYFSANPGAPPMPIEKVASGGELSRLMLVIKSLIANKTQFPTLIFDEIDSGISGEVAIKTGDQLKQLAHHHQVICITHLPQIAGKGETHFSVYKEIKDNRTVTRVKTLTGEERIVEIAKMLTGESVSDAAIASAKQLIAG